MTSPTELVPSARPDCVATCPRLKHITDVYDQNNAQFMGLEADPTPQNASERHELEQEVRMDREAALKLTAFCLRGIHETPSLEGPPIIDCDSELKNSLTTYVEVYAV